MALEPCIIFLVDELPNFIIWQVNSKIKVAKKAFVIVVALFLSIVNRKVIERIIVDLTNMFNSLIDRVLPTLQMSIDESKRGVFIVEPDCHRPLIPGHTGEPCFNLNLSQALKLILMLLLSKHDYKASNHNFLDDWNILYALRILV